MELPGQEDRITVIISTSPVRSNPSTDMLHGTLSSLAMVPLLHKAPKILVCDGCNVVASGKKAQHKAGRVSAEDEQNYAEFKRNVRLLAETGEPPFDNLVVIEKSRREGFGFAIHRGLVEVDTKYVMVMQHDQQLVSRFDLPAVLSAMDECPEVKYVGLCSENTKHYAEMIRSRYNLILERTLAFGGVPLIPLIFWYDKPHVCNTKHYRDVVFGKQNPFRKDAATKGADGVDAVDSKVSEDRQLENKREPSDLTAPLERSQKERPHGIVRRGDFIEEAFGLAMLADIVANGLGAHSKYGAYQLDEEDTGPTSGSGDGRNAGSRIHVMHVHGRRFWTLDQRAERGWPETQTETIQKRCAARSIVESNSEPEIDGAQGEGQ